MAIPHAAHVGGGSAVAGGLAWAKTAIAGVLVTGAVVGVTAGGEAIVHDSHSLAHRRPVAAPSPKATRPGKAKRAHRPAVTPVVEVARTTPKPSTSSSGGSGGASTASEQETSSSPEPVDTGESDGGKTSAAPPPSDDGAATGERESSDRTERSDDTSADDTASGHDS